jgi:hypothetical protein
MTLLQLEIVSLISLFIFVNSANLFFISSESNFSIEVVLDNIFSISNDLFINSFFVFR